MSEGNPKIVEPGSLADPKDVLATILNPEQRGELYPLFHRLRELAPVHPTDQLGPNRKWVLTGYDAVYGALRDHETFSSSGPGGYERRDRGATGGGLSMVLISDDPPRHTRFRQLVNKAFTPRRVGELEPWIGGVVDELLEGVGGEHEFVDGFTTPLPVTVIATLLGIPATERDRFKRWSNALLSGAAGLNEERLAIMGEMMEYLNGAIAAKRAEPTADLITALAEAEIDGERLRDWEVLGFCVLLLVAGNETTTNLLGNLLNVLVERPELWAQLRDDRSLVEPVIEETLRYDSPVQVLFRSTTRDVELCGTTIPARSPVLVCFAAANRDPAGFDEPDQFRLDRDLKKHLAFGMGVHYCLGSPLARSEARIGLNGLLDRFATVERGAEPALRQTATQIIRGFERLPLRLSA